jgi:hypothetical protein
LRERETERERQGEEKQAQVEKIKPLTPCSTSTPPLSDHALQRAQFKLKAGCKAIGKARPNPTFPLPWRGRFYSQGHIVRRAKRREKRMCGVVPMLGSTGADFPTNRKRKENGEWRGEAAANVINARVGPLGKSQQTPNAWRPVSEDCPFGKA